MAKFTPEDKKSLLAEIEQDIVKGRKYVTTNQQFDITFKVIVLCLGIGVVTFSALAAAKIGREGMLRGLSAVSAILGGISIAVSAFAVAQFNFQQRQQVQ